MQLIINPSIRKHFSENDEACFSEVMVLRGEMFREVANRKTFRCKLGEASLFVKLHFGVGWKEILKNILLGKKPVLGAEQERVAIDKLQQLGVSVPRVLGFGVNGVNPANQKSFLITEEVVHEFNLEQLAAKWQVESPSFKFKRQLIAAVADVARLMHAGGVNHRDFYLCHFLHTRKDTTFKLTLIDLHRAQIRNQVPLRWLIKDLSGLYYSATGVGLTKNDFRYFMCCYRQQKLRTILETEKALWEAVENKMQALLTKHGKYKR